jgi:dolichol kinase
MNRLKIIWILHKAAIITAMVAIVILIVCSTCAAMVGYEQGQFSVVSGQVRCIMPPGELICEEVAK